MNKESLLLGLEPSPIRELFEYGKKRKAEIGEDKVFDFSLGNPNLETPRIVKDKLIELLNGSSSFDLHGYTSAQGDPIARKAVADNLNKRFHADVVPELVFMTCGAASSLAGALQGIIENKEDEVIAFVPYFIEYKVFTNAARGTFIPVYPDKDMKPSLEELERKISKNTRAVIINSPNNPSGVLIDENTLKNICALLINKEKEYGHPIYLISDEPYRELIYNGSEYPFVFNYYNDSIVCYSFSKALSVPGERIGYFVVNKKCEDASNVYAAIGGAIRKLGYVSAPSLFQHLIPYVIDEEVNIDFYKKNRDYLYENLKRIGYEVIKPDGAFYMFVKALEDDAKAFALKARDHELLLVPSNAFGIEGYVRIAYCVSYKTIIDSIPAFEKLFEDYRGR